MRSRLGLAALALLAGCQMLPEEPPLREVPRTARPCVTAPATALERWMGEMTSVDKLSQEQAREQLSLMRGAGDSAFERYRYALLNQRIGDGAGWIRARDTLRGLREEGLAEPGLMQLVALLQRFSQAMINADARQQQLAEELLSSQQEREALADKIEALTNIEQTISERKNQGEDGG
ncbi:hypothetical protein [Parahaliea mediterranea]|uniref:Lipoprotein n=1 Tax=Parahaliea mediterranea TaxID=651086 RepID=A0A939DHZ8_9GAMM|nr:hypothetical protein [Parahaliea mediterranea]MBN7798680.1 hypothetical protein [Parahaliea mediterranea]